MSDLTGKKMSYPFSQEEMEDAAGEWGCNCGPSALAFALQVPLDHAHESLPGFDARRYVNLTMMYGALDALGLNFQKILRPTNTLHDMFSDFPSLVRVQWDGPWTSPGANGRWACTHTHWICTWLHEFDVNGCPSVFDCNGGVRTYESWKQHIVPDLIPARGDGNWYPTHVLRILDAPIACERLVS